MKKFAFTLLLLLCCSRGHLLVVLCPVVQRVEAKFMVQQSTSKPNILLPFVLATSRTPFGIELFYSVILEMLFYLFIFDIKRATENYRVIKCDYRERLLFISDCYLMKLIINR